jgi:large conductance mechanosensitive channel
MKGLKRFLILGNVVNLALALVIGAAFGTVFSVVVKALITPGVATY